MKTLGTLIIAALVVPAVTFAQQNYGTRTGEVSFSSAAPLENIEAVNHAAAAVFNVSTGDVQVSMLMKGFEFEKALMQEHFNENYVESGTFPKGVLKGKVIGFAEADLKKPGKHEATVDGDLTIHGVTQHITPKATITVAADGALSVASDFIVKPEDYKIIIPAVVRGHIAEEVKVKVRLELKKL